MDDRADSQAKALQEHISVVEENFSSLLQDFAAIARKSGKLRDKGDLLVKSLSGYSALEAPSVKSSLSGCAECFAALEDYREAQVGDRQMLGLIYDNLKGLLESRLLDWKPRSFNR